MVLQLCPDVLLLVADALPLCSPASSLNSIFCPASAWEKLPSYRQERAFWSMVERHDLPALQWALEKKGFCLKGGWFWTPQVYTGSYRSVTKCVVEGQLATLQLLVTHGLRVSDFVHLYDTLHNALAAGQIDTLLWIRRLLRERGVTSYRKVLDVTYWKREYSKVVRQIQVVTGT